MFHSIDYIYSEIIISKTMINLIVLDTVHTAERICMVQDLNPYKF